jgi:DnaJ-class molecular chaperone
MRAEHRNACQACEGEGILYPGVECANCDGSGTAPRREALHPTKGTEA